MTQQEKVLLDAFRKLPNDAKNVLVKFAVSSAAFEKVKSSKQNSGTGKAIP